MKALEDYRTLIAQVDIACFRIQEKYSDQIACKKGCAGNCCRIHLSIFPVEAVALALALKKLPAEKGRYIRDKARNAADSGPCPLLEDGGCLMYTSRLLICRTHGLPMRNEYRGRRSIGFCQKNFQHLDPIPNDAVIDLDDLNNRLAAINRRFVSKYSDCIFGGPQISIGEALLLQL